LYLGNGARVAKHGYNTRYEITRPVYSNSKLQGVAKGGDKGECSPRMFAENRSKRAIIASFSQKTSIFF